MLGKNLKTRAYRILIKFHQYPKVCVHDKRWPSSNYEHKQEIPSSTPALYQMRQNASTWNIKTGWKNPRYLPIFLWMWQLPTSMVCQRVCCNSFVEHICYDLTYTSIEKWKMKVEQGQGSGKPPFPCPRINCGFYLPSLSGKVSLFGFSSALHLSSFRFSNFTDTAAAVNTPAIPASMPPINAHLQLMSMLLLVSRVQANRPSYLWWPEAPQ